MREVDIKKRRFRDDLMQLKEQREAWQERERRELEEEDRRIASFLVERNDRDDARKKAEEAKKKCSSDLADRMCAKLFEEEVSFCIFCFTFHQTVHQSLNRRFLVEYFGRD